MGMTGNPTNWPYPCLYIGTASGIYVEARISVFTYSSQNQSVYGELLCPLLSRHYSRMRRKTPSKSPLLLLRTMVFLKDRSCRPTRRWTFIYRLGCFMRTIFFRQMHLNSSTRPLISGFMQFGRLAIVSSTESLLNVSEIS